MKRKGTFLLIGNLILIGFLLVVDLVMILDTWMTAIVVAVVSVIVSWISLGERSSDDLQDIIVVSIIVGGPVFGLAALGAWCFNDIRHLVSPGVYVSFAVAASIIGIALIVFSIHRWVKGIKASETEPEAKQGTGTTVNVKTTSLSKSTIDPANKEPVKKLLKVSTKVKFDMLQGTLGITKAEFEKHVVDWADKFDFTIEGDMLVIKGGDVDGFVETLFP